LSSDFLKKYLRELNELFDTINAKEFEALIESLKDAYGKKSQIFVCGNGGSASTASHIACDLNKGVNFEKDKRFKIICLSDNIPTIMAYANDVSYNEIFAEQLKNYMSKNDLIIGISSSGNSENVLKAIRFGNENGGKTFGICGYGGGKLKDIAQRSLVINCNDTQKVEDIHLIIFHCAMQHLIKQFH
jgi:D-sedoheptulose 7-phosphate isomerase